MISQKIIFYFLALQQNTGNRIQKKWFLGVDMSVCLSDEYLENYWADLDHILDLAVFWLSLETFFFIFWICLFFRVATIQKNAGKLNFLDFLENGAIKVFHFLHVEYMLSIEHFGI